MRLQIIALVLSVFATVSTAETFMGRTVQVVDGRSNNTSSAPLVVVMHGFRGTSQNMRKKTQFDALANSNDFLVAYPEGMRRRWNDGRNPNNQVDDVAYLSALISSLVSDGRADPRRIFVAGHSNGGGMAMRMACDRPSLIAGIAVVMSKSPTSYLCPHGRPIPAIFFHGTLDPIAPPEGRPDGHPFGGTLSDEAALAMWSARNGCGAKKAVEVVDDRDDGTSAQIIEYSDCSAALVDVSIAGHGHGWPGAGPRRPLLLGPATQEIDAAELSWWFFSGQ
jgi:polyhydroxybutyrate depolymerase